MDLDGMDPELNGSHNDHFAFGNISNIDHQDFRIDEGTVKNSTDTSDRAKAKKTLRTYFNNIGSVYKKILQYPGVVKELNEEINVGRMESYVVAKLPALHVFAELLGDDSQRPKFEKFLHHASGTSCRKQVHNTQQNTQPNTQDDNMNWSDVLSNFHGDAPASQDVKSGVAQKAESKGGTVDL
jgi:hypothetical protein